MAYLVPIIIFAITLAVGTIVETAAGLSSGLVLDNDAGVGAQSVVIAPDGLIDMRPEAALPRSPAPSTSLLDAIGI